MDDWLCPAPESERELQFQYHCTHPIDSNVYFFMNDSLNFSSHSGGFLTAKESTCFIPPRLFNDFL